MLGIASGFIRRFTLLFSLYGYDYIFIHREAAPIGPPVFEWMLAKILRKKIIYDFDDAIWLPNTSEHNKMAAGIKWHSKTGSICRWAYKVSCGNEFLCSYAKQFNKHVVLNPTTVDTENLHNKIKNQQNGKIAIGWTGTHSTIEYLNDLIPAIEELKTEIDFDFIIISNRQPDFKIRSLKFISWKKETEIEDLLKINVGIMPLRSDAWSEGKCGFKALQYMALGIPAVVSPVGVNNKIVDDGINGFLAKTNDEWKSALKTLLTDTHKRIEMGREARRKIEQHFSVKSNTENFLSLFN
jgi:glycosyltransferase involved in cell wall biosynthesis